MLADNRAALAAAIQRLIDDPDMRVQFGQLAFERASEFSLTSMAAAYLRLYDLHAEVVGFLGQRLATLFVHAISTQTDCLICSTFFRRWLVEAGEDPDALRLDERERAVVEFGRQLARDANGIRACGRATLRAWEPWTTSPGGSTLPLRR